jgi:hypothetical protein
MIQRKVKSTQHSEFIFTLGFKHSETHIILNSGKIKTFNVFGINTERDVFEEVFSKGSNDDYSKLLTNINKSKTDNEWWVTYCLTSECVNERDLLLFKALKTNLNFDLLDDYIKKRAKSETFNKHQRDYMNFSKKHKLQTVFYDATTNEPTDLKAHNENDVILNKYWKWNNEVEENLIYNDLKFRLKEVYKN